MSKSRLGWVRLGLIVFALGAHAGKGSEPFSFKLPQPARFQVEIPAKAAKSLPAQPPPPAQWLRALDDANQPVELGSRVVLQLSRAEDLVAVIAGMGLEVSRQVAPGTYILSAPDAATAVGAAQRLCQTPGVLASYPVLSRSAKLHGPYSPRPNDRFFYMQWPLENRLTNNAARTGVDLNARAAWPWTRGEGITVAVVDMGVELTHPDLIAATGNLPHFNFESGTANGFPSGTSATWAHGTEVAGLIAAQADNQIGLSGLAPAARLASWVIFRTNLLLVSDEALMDMYQFQNGRVHVQNHSWAHLTVRQEAPTLLEQIGLSNALVHGRAERGVVMVRSAGNDRDRGDNANDDGYVADPRIISVAAVRADGRVASYSEPGTPILVAGPSGDVGSPGLFTTDLTGTRGMNDFNFFPPNTNLNDYVFDALGFSGTSAAAALISGTAALVLSANPNLTSRDVRQVMLLSARHWDLSDPDLRTNGAGLRVSHNLGFGVPDAGWAVQLARQWSNRPPMTSLTFTAAAPAAIPDAGLRLLLEGDNLPPDLASIPALGGTGPFPDDPTPIAPLVDAGTALNPVSLDLAGKVALIQRAQDNWAQQITNVAAAGARLAVVYNDAAGSDNCPGGAAICPLLRTDFTPIPAVFIRQADGEALRARLGKSLATWGGARLFGANLGFAVTNTLVCEDVAVRLQTDHPLRGDLRITLTSPQGTRSILQRFNQDTNAGPVDWTYTSTHHFYESSAGNWVLTISDLFPGLAGAVQFASLTLRGVPITDTDHDGLDDAWELKHFGSLAQGPRDDPDGDGASNAREQILGANPTAPDVPQAVDVSRWSETVTRLTWPGLEGQSYTIWSSPNLAAGFEPVTNILGRYPETEWCLLHTNQPQRFYRVSSP
jgi:subtilisin family serine protease